MIFGSEHVWKPSTINHNYMVYKILIFPTNIPPNLDNPTSTGNVYSGLFEHRGIASTNGFFGRMMIKTWHFGLSYFKTKPLLWVVSNWGISTVWFSLGIDDQPWDWRHGMWDAANRVSLWILSFWRIVATCCNYSTLWQRSVEEHEDMIDLAWSDDIFAYICDMNKDQVFPGITYHHLKLSIGPTTVVIILATNVSALRRDSCKQSNRNQWNSPCRWVRQDLPKAIEMDNVGWGKWRKMKVNRLMLGQLPYLQTKPTAH